MKLLVLVSGLLSALVGDARASGEDAPEGYPEANSCTEWTEYEGEVSAEARSDGSTRYVLEMEVVEDEDVGWVDWYADDFYYCMWVNSLGFGVVRSRVRVCAEADTEAPDVMTSTTAILKCGAEDDCG